jgi:ParB-like chromosome segregation protein Spo0J
MKIKTSDVIVPPRMREVDKEKVKDLAASIEEIGLLQPIILLPTKELIAGLHRLEAFKILAEKRL